MYSQTPAQKYSVQQNILNNDSLHFYHQMLHCIHGKGPVRNNEILHTQYLHTDTSHTAADAPHCRFASYSMHCVRAEETMFQGVKLHVSFWD